MVETANQEATPTADREIVTTRTYDAPRALVFSAWTSAEHLAAWWGPDGFSITTLDFVFDVGGVWRFIMHGPDGTDWQNRVVYESIVWGERIAYAHGDWSDGPPLFKNTITFQDEGAGTKVTMRAVFPTAAARDFVVRERKAVEGGKQTLARLAGHVAAEKEKPRFQTSRVFDAPRRLVFAAWSTAENMKQWFAPDGFTMEECVHEFRPGGTFSFVFRGHGMVAPCVGTFREVVPHERIVFAARIHDEIDAVTTLTFLEHDGKTTLAVDQVYSKSGPPTEGAPVGWGQTLDHLAAFVARS